MSLTQGSPLPNITTSQTQTTTAPSWYTDYLSGLAAQTGQAGAGAQYAGASPLQQAAFSQAESNVGNYLPLLQQSANLARTAGTTDVAQAAGQFMNPYTQNVVNTLQNLGQRNIQQYLAPAATSAAVGAGQFGSKRGAEALGNAVNAGLQNLSAQQAQALQTGYTQSLQAAQNQVANQLAASGQLGTLANQTQAGGLADVNALSTLGAQQQQIAQNEKLFPLSVAQQQANVLKGYTVPTQVSSSYTGPIPGAYSSSPLAQIAGLGSVLGGISTTPLGKSIMDIVGGGISDLTKGIFSPTQTGATEIPNPDFSTPGAAAEGWQYYSDGTAINSKTGEYYQNGQLIWSPTMYSGSNQIQNPETPTYTDYTGDYSGSNFYDYYTDTGYGGSGGNGVNDYWTPIDTSIGPNWG